MSDNYINNIRQDFPILNKKVYNKPLVYFDNAASAQKPLAVINAISNYYINNHANIHRAFHYLGDRATELYEQSRENIAEYINAKNSAEVIFTRGTTEGINLVATVLERSGYFEKLDEIILTVAEHHSNIVPWQILAERTGAVIKVIDILSNGDLNINQLYEHVRTNKSKIKLLAIAHVYNGTGVVNPIKSIIEQVKSINNNILILVDGAQAVPNFKIDVQDLKCDFYAFSGHKIYGPTGIGVLYGKSDLLNSLPPYHGGGEMIDQVILPSGTTYAQIPHRFEAGTPDISGVIGLSAAIDYLKNLDFTKIITHKANLLNYCTQRLATIENLFIIGTSNNKVSLVAFTIDKLNPQDIGLLLDQYGIAVRTGHHCNMPLMTYLDLAGTIRVSFGIYNTIEEIDIFIASLKQVIKKLK